MARSGSEWMSMLNLVVTPNLPAPPSDGINAKRMVRHGLRDVLEWLGEHPGPEPGEEIHFMEGGTYTSAGNGSPVLYCSLHGLSLIERVAELMDK